MTTAVIVGSLVPNNVVVTLGFGLRDTAMHAGAYFILMVCFAGLYRRTLYPIIAVVLLALGLGLDFLQLLTDTRSFDWKDIAMNSAGVFVGLILSFALIGGWCQRVEQRLLS